MTTVIHQGTRNKELHHLYLRLANTGEREGLIEEALKTARWRDKKRFRSELKTLKELELFLSNQINELENS